MWILFRAIATLILATWQLWFIQGLPGKASNLGKGLPTWPSFYIGSLCKDFRDLRVNKITFSAAPDSATNIDIFAATGGYFFGAVYLFIYFFYQVDNTSGSANLGSHCHEELSLSASWFSLISWADSDSSGWYLLVYISVALHHAVLTVLQPFPFSVVWTYSDNFATAVSLASTVSE